MVSISSSLSSYSPPVSSVSVSAPVSAPDTSDSSSDDSTPSSTTVASNANDVVPASYTAQASESSSNIRGTSVNTSV